jgi:hypothetical protein
MITKLSTDQLFEYYRAALRNGEQPNTDAVAKHFDVIPATVRVKLRFLVSSGKLFKKGSSFYLNAKDIPTAPQRERKLKEETNRLKSEAGKAGAEALKRLAFETGKQRFTPGMGADANKIAANIENIVRRAQENGTLYHPRPNYVVPVGQKVG